jgi:hypothetical protein
MTINAATMLTFGGKVCGHLLYEGRLADILFVGSGIVDDPKNMKNIQDITAFVSCFMSAIKSNQKHSISFLLF